ncbi:MAG: NifB/NifX family molybdenum-iron cluster-binding protein [Candidatus Bathyarchaeota archaeon]|nr:NifB/NifX family molybdenum-iron cluster-binding protein [Candidatus Bathyarchaeota archaeon]
MDPRFGRSPYHLIVETDTMAFEAAPNASMNAPSGAGIGAAQAVAQRGVEAVLTGNLGPNATTVLSQAGIKMYTGAAGSVRQAVEALKSGELSQAPSVGAGGVGYARGKGGGRGMGRGMDRGMGMRGTGMGRGMYNYPTQPPMPTQPTGQTTREQEKGMFAQQLEQLERQLREVKKRLEELK